ncbi:IS3 family transposase [Kitasatospora sp. NPDC088346]|uniref:IS3 family transposase n=1 Tax=Kitasatospora sp. NPDC088346 TaxID=3364073 RepID=UPI00380C9ED3
MSRFQFVEDHREAFEVKRLCQVLGIQRSSYYKWRATATARAERQEADAALAARIQRVHTDSDGAYGAPRITAELRDDGLVVNEKRVARVMRKFGIVGTHLRRKVRTTVSEPSATHHVARTPAPAARDTILRCSEATQTGVTSSHRQHC